MFPVRLSLKRSVSIGLSAAIVCIGLIGAAAPAWSDTGCPTAAASYDGGAGTPGSPYEISTPSQLQRLKNTTADYDKHFILTKNVVMGGCTWSSPIADGSPSLFTGTLDGDGHVISGLTIAVTNASISYVGLIGYLGTNGVVKNLGFTGGVSLVVSSGSSEFAYVGGLVGFMAGSTQVSNSFSTGNVTVDVTTSERLSITVGGLVGYVQGPVSDTFSRGNVTARGVSTAGVSSRVMIDAGGLVGVFGSTTISNTYSSGLVSVSGNAARLDFRVGGLLGVREVSLAATALFWDTSTSLLDAGTGFGSSTGLNGATTAEMNSPDIFTAAGWSLSEGFSSLSTWGMCSSVNSGYPFLTAFYSTNPCISSDPRLVPPSWHQSFGRLSASEPCPAGWNPSWAQWMNNGSGGFVCNREIYWNVNTDGWAIRVLEFR